MSEEYPRPDFVREDLKWASLDGPWSLLFDDDDIGRERCWHIHGLPSEVNVSSEHGNSSRTSDSQDIVAKIASGTQELLQQNMFKRTETLVHKKRDILVPYVFQCPASGINEKCVHEVLWYEREVQDLRSEVHKEQGHRVVVRFGAVDYEAAVWVNGQYFGGHRGGHVPFDLDITDAFLSGTLQRLTMRVYDSAHDLTQPRGKQYWKAQPESIFYTPSGGIWQSVWLESVPAARIGDSSSGTVLKGTDIEGGKLYADVKILGRPAAHAFSVEIDARLGGELVSKTNKIELPHDSDVASLKIDVQVPEDQVNTLKRQNLELDSPTAWHNNTAVWSPEHPTLYELTIRLYSPSSKLPIDTIHTTIGMRSLSWNHSDSTFRLNNRPYFQALFLDQGYWPDTFMTPPSSAALKTDIQLAKAMGFNGCRKHQKVEDPRFLYWADKLGFLVWGEMANAYAFSAAYAERFDQEWREAVRRDINHASLVAWTPVNESWAYTDLATNLEQRNHIRSLYHATKVLDPTRPVNDNCGWEHVQTDLTTFHDYSDAQELSETCSSMEGILGKHGGRPLFLNAIDGDPGSKHAARAPVLCTEFGGVNIARSAAGNEGEREWGYTTASDPKDLLMRIGKMMHGIVDGGHICGFVYTQLTDIEQEVNGLYTIDRQEKLDVAEVRKIVDEVKAKYAKMHS